MALRKQIRPAGILHVQRGNTMKPTRTVTTTTTRVVATTTTSCKHHQKGHNFDDDAQKNPFGSPFTFGPIDTNPSTSSASAGPQSTAGGDKSGSPNGDGSSNTNNKYDGSTGDSSQKSGNTQGNGGGNDRNDSDSDSDDDGNDGGNGNNGNGNNKFPNFKGANNFPCEAVNENDGRLQYTGTWVLESKDPNGIFLTTHTTSSAGSQVAISFNGTSITVVGVVHASNATVPPAVASYTIDSGPTVSLPLPFSTRDVPNQQFFESPDLPLASHVLLINITSDGSPYTLDTLYICSKSTNPIAAVLAPTTAPANRKQKTEIIAGTLGSALVLVSLVLAVILLRRRRRSARAQRTANSPIRSWLERQTSLFTSSTSILRNNPSNPSTGDPYEDKLSRAEKAAPSTDANPSAPATAIAGPSMPIPRDSKIVPPVPGIMLKDTQGAAPDGKRSTTVRRASDSSSWLLPALTLGSELSDKIPFSERPEAFRSLPPHPSLPATGDMQLL